jgi:hypothetical protein
VRNLTQKVQYSTPTGVEQLGYMNVPVPVTVLYQS